MCDYHIDTYHNSGSAMLTPDLWPLYGISVESIMEQGLPMIPDPRTRTLATSPQISDYVPTVDAELQQRIINMEKPYNWNKHRAKAITNEVCLNAISLINLGLARRIPKPIAIVPSPRGKIIIEWHIGNGAVLLAEVSPDENEVYMQYAPPKVPSVETVTDSDSVIKKLVELATAK